ncbi:hypothetical protein JTE90_002551 [Oedothorax gibbosus]|uniref:Peptidase aspartic putative domain-containing protein n=1 Tax=Oedothorax gibbosus TaxID=931172 RepID=A0AAV6V5K7_9ARAC|nr:hypothetical protein JTE90_002551 [Oedothorax gibbosus]
MRERIKIKTGYGTEVIQQELFGGGKTAPASHNAYSILLRSLDASLQFEVSALDQERICSYVPRVRDAAIFNILEKMGIHLSDYSSEVGENSDIQILLGADVRSKIITSQHCSLKKDLVAVKTRLGWSVIGKSESGYKDSSSILVSLVASTDISRLWDLESLGITESGVKAKQQRDKALDFFGKTVARDPTGRYMDPLDATSKNYLGLKHSTS